MTEHISMEATRLALKLILTDDSEDNERAFLLSLKSVADPFDRLGIALHTSRVLASKIRESAHAAGQLEHVLENVQLALCESLMDEEDS